MDFSPRRIFNLSRQIIAEGVAFDDEAREAFHRAMQWPEVEQVEDVSAQDKSARHAAQLIGSGNVDEMVMRVWEARQRKARKDAEANE